MSEEIIVEIEQSNEQPDQETDVNPARAGCAAAILIGTVALPAVFSVAYKLRKQEEEVTVTKTEHVVDRFGDERLMVYGVDTEGGLQVYTVNPKSTKAYELYGSLKEGETYNLSTRGFRIPFARVFREINQASLAE